MKNLPAHCYRLVIATVFLFSCSKQSLQTPVSESVPPVAQTPSAAQVLHISFVDITIDSSQSYTFDVPEITRSIVDSGYVSAMALNPSDEAQVWQSLPIISSCSQRLEISSIGVGKVSIKNDLGTPVTMSYRFDIVASN